MTVSELAAEVRGAIERGVAGVWVEGEVVDFRLAASGHWYFSLHDGTAQIKAVCWKGTNFRIRWRPENGMTVRVRGAITFWEAKGELKLNVDSLEPSGEGALRAAFEQIKSRLEAEGLFDPALKRPIPFLPRRIGVITSRKGAAFDDIRTVLLRRARSVSILLVPTLVQGEGAADSIRRAVEGVNEYNRSLPAATRIDVLIVGRGGGSAEDLWAFNDEALARCLRLSEIPVISAVGHEIDWTIADMVADLRAATPSAAAELVASREEDLASLIDARSGQLESLLEYKLLIARSRFEDADDELNRRFQDGLGKLRDCFTSIKNRLTPSMLISRAAAAKNTVAMLDQRQNSAMHRFMALSGESLTVKMAKLDALSPLAVLTRGYSITQTGDGRIVRDAEAVKPGERLSIRLERGKLNAEVLASE